MAAENREAGLIPEEKIADRILLIREVKVMIDSDLADLFAVPTKRLNEQVRRNITRFPYHFMFHLNKMEKE
ncbi:ORF6N domain-containing protein [Bacteroidota bacterium]